MTAIQQHFVTFYSPGTFVAETSMKPIDAWSIDLALTLVGGIKERYGAIPYGFDFLTRGRDVDDLDSKVIARSPFYWLGGKVETLAEVEARNDPKESILRGNMRGNDWDKIIKNTNSWKWTQPLKDTDVILDWTPEMGISS